MRYLGLGIVVLAVVAMGVYLLPAGYNESSAPDRERETATALPHSVNSEVGTASMPRDESEQTMSMSVQTTKEQQTAAIEQEKIILDMAREYEVVRSDPEKRLAMREQMRQELAAYSEAALPIAMEKIEAAQSTH